MPNHKLDTDTQVFFYENDFYVLSNFSAFEIEKYDIIFPTSEHLYHYEKFTDCPFVQELILESRSAHEAYRIAQLYKYNRDPDWDSRKVDVMMDILFLKVEQHEYVYQKLMATGDRELIEDSWRDDFWGWGPDGKGRNVLGKLWMEVRETLRDVSPSWRDE